VYARPEVSGTPATLGVSGMLWRDALVMYDRTTRSLWSQIDGKAVAGPMKGERLAEVPSEQTTWGKWKRRHPGTLVLVKPTLRGSPYAGYFADPETIGVRGSRNPDPRLGAKELVIGIERENQFAAVPLGIVEKRGVFNTEAWGVPLVVTRTASFVARAGERRLMFDSAGHALRDRETGSIWSLESGEAIDGPLKGSRLERVSSKIAYWGVWARFHESEVLRTQK